MRIATFQTATGGWVRSHCEGTNTTKPRSGSSAREVDLSSKGRFSVAATANDLGELAKARGDTAEAEAHYREAMAELTWLEHPEAAIAALNVQLMAHSQGRFAETLEQLQKLMLGFRQRKQGQLVGASSVFMARALAELQRWQEAGDALHRGRRALEKSPLVELDIATAAERVGDLTAPVDAELARRAYLLSLRQWSALGSEADMARLTAALAGPS